MNGEFLVKLPKVLKEKEIQLQISSPGYDVIIKKFKIADLPKKEWLVLLNYKEKMLMGDVEPDWQGKH